MPSCTNSVPLHFRHVHWNFLTSAISDRLPPCYHWHMTRVNMWDIILRVEEVSRPFSRWRKWFFKWMWLFLSGYDDIFLIWEKKKLSRGGEGAPTADLLVVASCAAESPAADPLVRNGAGLDGRCFTSGTLCLCTLYINFFDFFPRRRRALTRSAALKKS